VNEIPRSVRVVTAPAYEPITLVEAKLFCRIDTDDTAQDAVVTLLITAARERAEAITGRAFIQRDMELLMDDLPTDGSAIELAYSPIRSVSYIRYRDAAGIDNELSGSPDVWLLDSSGTPGRIAPLAGASWPATNGTISNVRIGYRCGYAPVGSPDNEAAYQAGMPALLRTWMAVRVSSFYEQRESIVIGSTVAETPRDYVDGLLDGLKVIRGFA